MRNSPVTFLAPEQAVRPPSLSTRRVENFLFDVEDRIIVREIQRPGVVEALLVDSRGPQYRICYWADRSRKSEWLYPWEIELRHA